MSDQQLDFWFSIGSTYSYLSVMRVDAVAKQHGIAVAWRPFNIRTITREMNNSPFAGKPVKAAYMWRDIGRRAAKYGLQSNLPAPYPITDFDIANHVAIVGRDEGWLPSYARETYRRWMVDGQQAGSEPNLSSSLTAIGEDAARVIARAKTEQVAGELSKATDEVRKLGIFGAPSFVARGEVFWGDDRLEDAIQWFKHGSLVSM